MPPGQSLAGYAGSDPPNISSENRQRPRRVHARTANTKAKKAKAKKTNDTKQRRQAEAVVRLLHDRFPDAAWNSELFIVAGDLNDEPGSPPVAPLVTGAGLENALERITPEADRWTHWYRSDNTVAALDYMLLSPGLATATAGQAPVIEHRGISYASILQSGQTGPRKTRYQRRDEDPKPISTDFGFQRFTGVTPTDYASDHCAVFLDVP